MCLFSFVEVKAILGLFYMLYNIRHKIKFLCPCLSMFIVTPIVGVCNCSMFCYALLYAHSSFEIILMGKKELVAFLRFSC